MNIIYIIINIICWYIFFVIIIINSDNKIIIMLTKFNWIGNKYFKKNVL